MHFCGACWSLGVWAACSEGHYVPTYATAYVTTAYVTTYFIAYVFVTRYVADRGKLCLNY